MNYINKNATSTVIANNFSALAISENNYQTITNEFIENAKLLPNRKNGNYLYHEIISIKPTDKLTTHELENALTDIARKYINIRAKNHLTYVKIHLNTDNPHIHFCISANELNSNKRARLSKEHFKSIQKELETYTLTKYTELENRPIYNNLIDENDSKLKLYNKTQELKQRTKQPSKKEQIKQLLENIFNNAKTHSELLKLLEDNDLEIYQRGKTISVKNLKDSKKYRLKTLALDKLFTNTKERLNLAKQRVSEIKTDIERVKTYNTKPMNAKQAKSIKLIELLSLLNHKAISVKNSDYWYKSPFRDEKTPSFKVNDIKNLWYDHGIGKGGNILDFTLAYFNVNNIAQALQKLTEIKANELITDVRHEQIILEPFAHKKIITEPQEIIQPNKEISKTSPFILNKIQELENRALIDYLHSRSIETEQAKKFLKEAYYRLGNKNFFSLAFKNQSGGYELRNKYFKSNIGGKDISFINNYNKNNVSIFEGFFDYLAALQFFKQNLSDVIILNSTALIEKATEFIKLQNYQNITTFLDNDKGGKQALEFLKEQIPNKIITDKSEIYRGYNDFNDFYIGLKGKELELQKLNTNIEPVERLREIIY